LFAGSYRISVRPRELSTRIFRFLYASDRIHHTQLMLPRISEPEDDLPKWDCRPQTTPGAGRTGEKLLDEQTQVAGIAGRAGHSHRRFSESASNIFSLSRGFFVLARHIPIPAVTHRNNSLMGNEQNCCGEILLNHCRSWRSTDRVHMRKPYHMTCSRRNAN
jgi:hypothetical protein